MKIFSTARELFFLLSHPALWFRRALSKQDLDPDPIAQFGRWFEQAKKRWRGEFPNWLCLSTVDSEGYPNGRIVLLKEYDEQGFVFYTNSHSRKGQELGGCPKAAMTFFWESLQHQVRIVGDVERVDNDQADAYFATRPRQSQIGAWASEQSSPIESRNELLLRMKKFTEQFKGQDVPRPPHWAGYRLKPLRFEFWELRMNRLHDRFIYTHGDNNGAWNIQQLCP